MLKRWNENGIDGLIPRYDGGNPPKLSKENLESLDKILLKTPNLTNNIVSDIIEYEFSVKFSDRHVSRILSLIVNFCANIYKVLSLNILYVR